MRYDARQDHHGRRPDRRASCTSCSRAASAISIRGAVVERVGPGGVFGEMALVDQSPRSANAAAETDCTLLAINRNVFLNLVKADPELRHPAARRDGRAAAHHSAPGVN